MMSYSDIWTDKEIEKLETRIRREYGAALKDVKSMLDDFINGTKYEDSDGNQARGKSLMEKSAAFRALVEKGERTEEDYRQWLLNQAGRGKRFETLRDNIAERMTNANETAMKYINGKTAGVFAFNRNYEGYTIERVAGASDFALFDENTVKRLVMEEPDVMPYYPKSRAIERGIDLDYGKSQITKRITSGILSGASIPTIAKNLREGIVNMNYTSSVRAARTAMTAAQNAGRMETYHEAEKMGIKLKRKWVATLDNRTRHMHQILDGQEARIGDMFHVDGYEIEYPGDPKAPGFLTYNCRCTLIAVLDDHKYADTHKEYDPDTGEYVEKKNLSYAEWARMKKASEPVANDSDAGIIDGEMNPITGAIERLLESPVEHSDDSHYQVLLDGLRKQAETSPLDYNPVHMASSAKAEDEIISQLCGGDYTAGSCASVGLAYIGQKQGWEVLDFRDGDSRRYFSRSDHLRELAHAKGVVAKFYGDEAGKTSVTLASNFLKSCEPGKEYYLGVGRHASIVRKLEETVTDPKTGKAKMVDRFQYLELQSARSSGWTYFDGNPKYTLANRFGCASSSGRGEYWDFMINVTDSNFDTDEFRSILGYINTDSDKQRKGAHGTIK